MPRSSQLSGMTLGVSLSVLDSVLGALQASATDRPGEHQGRAGHEADQRRAVAVLERVGILHLAMEGLDHLSGGQRQLVSLAQSLVREPRVLLLDEPISALDLQHQLRVMRLVQELARERGMIAIMETLLYKRLSADSSTIID